jgi:hypothetical protein
MIPVWSTTRRDGISDRPRRHRVGISGRGGAWGERAEVVQKFDAAAHYVLLRVAGEVRTTSRTVTAFANR